MTSYSQSPTRRRIIRGEESDVAETATLFIDVVRSPGQSNGSMQDVIEASRNSGYEEGYQAAMAEFAEAEASARAAQLRRVADAIVNASQTLMARRAEVVQVAAAEAAALAFELAEALLQRELSISASAVDALQRALELIPSGHELVVRVNPDDPIDPAEIAAMVPDVQVKVVADRAVESGGCIVIAGPCRIDTQIGPALERARAIIAELYADPHFEELVG